MSTSWWADRRKAIAITLTGAATVAGQLTNASLVHGQGALWIAFGITVADAVAGVFATYVPTNGATLTQRVTEIEKAALPAVGTIEQGVKTLNVGLHPMSDADHAVAMAKIPDVSPATAVGDTVDYHADLATLLGLPPVGTAAAAAVPAPEPDPEPVVAPEPAPVEPEPGPTEPVAVEPPAAPAETPPAAAPAS